jgi:hypothetical protein
MAEKLCRHFSSLLEHDECKLGVKYGDVWDISESSPRLPCLGEVDSCEKFSAFTPEEMAERFAQFERAKDLIQQGLSPCCEAPIDTSQVIQEGRNKGHGPRYCSKCGDFVFGS